MFSDKKNRKMPFWLLVCFESLSFQIQNLSLRMSTTQTQKAPILPKHKTGLAVGWGRGFRITKRPLKERYRDVRKRVNIQYVI
jgi:hypothetical protein